MERLSLQAIKNAVNGCGEYDCEIESVCIDTRKIEPNCLYIAIKGENFDGHTFIEQALQSGANAVLSEKPIEGESRIIVVEDTKQALLDLAKYYKSLFHVFTVGVTGSVGKTSTKEMIYTILNAKGKTLKTQGNFNNEIGMPMTMFALGKEYENAVLEMGMSDFGEISALTKVCTPNVGVITNIGVSHIETLKTQENILKAKLEITDGMEHDATLVLNADDPFLSKVNTMIDRPVLYYGIEASADVTASDIVQNETSTSFTINYYGKSIQAEIPTIGKHNVKNALAGFCVGLLADIPPEQIVASMKWYKNANMRQNVKKINGIIVIEDCYNASPDSMNAAIDVISNTNCNGRRFCVLGDMLELGDISEEAHVEVGKMVGRSRVDVLLCYGELAKEIKRGAIMMGMKNVFHFEEKENLVDYIKANVEPGDAIIYKASRGMKLEEVILAVNEDWLNN
ncbi:UDP-N-acetylmuramoyl-tripeptide--D-alanyl-D-alanine ligase [Paludicola sp. MB14-C6]|uniref:UDP-N-acetylmuramoyl-tripeptide--D-alanyl-D- alanine ligase n=1 Tax=Paludihabitans sp. MB14-C6 TaxID=3070656 RepID=UPI0027DCDA4A|nr:UDP-N-acetylmuramoyl-tripeptide--D-alanyl-D-alanine ligase [Paludicola sp. MB14-C6]WMJ23763.1 UDP-N-acetylmuramoyl-tripeptide--D-alanyl-D-alanine ligase [Paludicola sp. MB14-C6]